MSFLGDLFSDPLDTIGNVVQDGWDMFADIPGSPAAITDGAIGALSGQYSLNPWSEGPSAFDVGFSGESSANDPERRAIGRGIATGVGSYITGGALGSMMGSTTGGAAASGALWGGAQAAGTGGNIEKAMLRGGVAGGLSSFAPDVAGYASVTDPVYAGMINGGTQGAVMGALSNGEKGALEGALTGGTLGGLSGYDRAYGPPPDDLPGTLGGTMQDANGESTVTLGSINNAQARANSSLPLNVRRPLSASYGESGISGQTGLGDLTQPTQESSWANPDLGNFMEKIMPSSARGWGDLAQGAMGMYGAYKQRKMARDLQSQIGGNRSAYQKQLTRDLQRRDAAAGRRSNYSGRATELQSSLAQLDSRNAPALAQLQQAELGGLVNMFQTGLRYGNKAGWFGSPDTQQQPIVQPQQPLYLPSMMGQQQGPQDYSLDQQRKIKFGGYGG